MTGKEALWVVMLVPVLACADARAQAKQQPMIGRPAAAISGRSLDGTPVALADVKGKIVVAHFAASW